MKFISPPLRIEKEYFHTYNYLTECLLIFSAIQSQVRPLLEKLRSDGDLDVQFYAVEALDG